MKKRIIATTAAVIVATTLVLPGTSAFGWTRSTSAGTFVTTTQQPTIQYYAPTTQPTNTTQQPTQSTTTTRSTSAGAFTTTTQQPTTTQPTTTTQQPTTSVQQPTATTQQQPSTTQNNTTNNFSTTVNSSRLTLEQINSLNQQMLQMVNQARQQHGLNPLILDPQVTQVAQIKSEEMVQRNYFSHNSPTYGSPANMLKTFGVKYTRSGENLAKAASVTNAFNNLMNSDGHRRNILNPSYTHIGLGVDRHPSGVSGGHYVFTQMFIGR